MLHPLLMCRLQGSHGQIRPRRSRAVCLEAADPWLMRATYGLTCNCDVTGSHQFRAYLMPCVPKAPGGV